jgi:hypothetical protein
MKEEEIETDLNDLLQQYITANYQFYQCSVYESNIDLAKDIEKSLNS